MKATEETIAPKWAAPLAAWVLLLVVGLPFPAPAATHESLRMALKLELLEQINRDRARHGLPPVALDLHASAIADAYCEEQVRHRTLGHFGIDGLAPYMRYSLAGGDDGLSQNTAAWSAPYEFPEDRIGELIRRSHMAMVAEIPPDDGHRRAILDPFATHVGLGLAWNGGEIRMTEEFLRRYIHWSRPLPRVAALGERPWGSGRVIDGFAIDRITVHWERHPAPLTPAMANRIASYSLPRLQRDYRPRLHDRSTDPIAVSSGPAARAHGETFPLDHLGEFTFAVPLQRGPGVYTVVVWVQSEAGDRIPASNISIRIGQASATHLGRRDSTTGSSKLRHD